MLNKLSLCAHGGKGKVSSAQLMWRRAWLSVTERFDRFENETPILIKFSIAEFYQIIGLF
jgi:hypothetical protein